jgi:long-chain acyl-CoA synthetase
MGLTYFVDVDAIDRGDAIVYAAPMSHGSGLYAIPHCMAAGYGREMWAVWMPMAS